jgi:hypothetical protein
VSSHMLYSSVVDALLFRSTAPLIRISPSPSPLGVPGIISWPAIVTGPARVSWDPVITMDFLATVMEVLDIERPAHQQDWAFDGISAMPILRGETPAIRGFGHMYMKPDADAKEGYAYRYGNWKLAVGGISCDPGKSSFNCSKPQLYDMATDIGENFDLADKQPEILAAILRNFTVWQKSVLNSMANESMCTPHPGPSPSPQPFPPSPQPSSACEFVQNSAMDGDDIAFGTVQTQEECCGACKATKGCGGADFRPVSAMRPAWDGSAVGGTYVCPKIPPFLPLPPNFATTNDGRLILHTFRRCHLKADFSTKQGPPGAVACKPQ